MVASADQAYDPEVPVGAWFPPANAGFSALFTLTGIAYVVLGVGGMAGQVKFEEDALLTGPAAGVALAVVGVFMIGVPRKRTLIDRALAKITVEHGIWLPFVGFLVYRYAEWDFREVGHIYLVSFSSHGDPHSAEWTVMLGVPARGRRRESGEMRLRMGSWNHRATADAVAKKLRVQFRDAEIVAETE